MSWWISRSMI